MIEELEEALTIDGANLIYKRDMIRNVRELLKNPRLTHREMIVLDEYYFKENCYAEISKMFAVTRQTVGQIKRKALKKLRLPSALNQELYEDYKNIE